MKGGSGAARVPPAVSAESDTLSKPALHAFADRLLADEPDAVERCVAFHVRRYAAWVLSEEHLRERPSIV